MARMILTHGVGDMETWLKGGAERERLFAQCSSAYRIYRQEGSDRVAIVAEDVDMVKAQALMGSEEAAAAMRGPHGPSASGGLRRDPRRQVVARLGAGLGAAARKRPPLCPEREGGRRVLQGLIRADTRRSVAAFYDRYPARSRHSVNGRNPPN